MQEECERCFLGHVAKELLHQQSCSVANRGYLLGAMVVRMAVGRERNAGERNNAFDVHDCCSSSSLDHPNTRYPKSHGGFQWSPMVHLVSHAADDQPSTMLIISSDSCMNFSNLLGSQVRSNRLVFTLALFHYHCTLAAIKPYASAVVGFLREGWKLFIWDRMSRKKAETYFSYPVSSNPSSTPASGKYASALFGNPDNNHRIRMLAFVMESVSERIHVAIRKSCLYSPCEKSASQIGLQLLRRSLHSDLPGCTFRSTTT